MFNIGEIRPKSLVGQIKSPKFLWCLYIDIETSVVIWRWYQIKTIDKSSLCALKCFCFYEN